MLKTFAKYLKLPEYSRKKYQTGKIPKSIFHRYAAPGQTGYSKIDNLTDLWSFSDFAKKKPKKVRNEI